MKILFFITLLVPSLVFSQIDGEWIGYDQTNTKKKMIINGDFMIMFSFGYDDIPENSKWRAYDSIPIENKSDNILVIKNKKGGDGYSAGVYNISKNGSILTLAKLRKGFVTSKQASEAASNYQYTALTGERYYSPNYTSQMEGMKTLDELNKADLMTVIKQLQTYDKDMESLLSISDARMQRMAFYFTQSIMNNAFVDLGYNPYKMTESWFYKRFMDDPDIKEMMEKQIHLKLN